MKKTTVRRRVAMKKALRGLVLGLVFGLIFFSFALAEGAGRIGLILATGGLGDKSFNDISYAGALKAKEELGVELELRGTQGHCRV